LEGRRLQQDDRQPVGFDWSKITKTKPGELGIRFLFGAVVALAAAITGTLAGPKVGGLFLAFPAILPASLTLIEKKEGLSKAWSDASGGAMGAIGLAAFALTAVLLLPTSPALALILALVAWILVSTGLYFLIRASGLFLASDRLFSNRD
jgi:Protein of unknown function (DUF3147)